MVLGEGLIHLGDEVFGRDKAFHLVAHAPAFEASAAPRRHPGGKHGVSQDANSCLSLSLPPCLPLHRYPPQGDNGGFEGRGEGHVEGKEGEGDVRGKHHAYRERHLCAGRGRDRGHARAVAAPARHSRLQDFYIRVREGSKDPAVEGDEGKDRGWTQHIR